MGKSVSGDNSFNDGDELERNLDVTYHSYKDFFEPLFKEQTKKYEENDYRNLFAMGIFKVLELMFPDCSDHIKAIVTGYFCAEINLLMNRDEHLDSDYKRSYNDYLRKTIINIKNRQSFMGD